MQPDFKFGKPEKMNLDDLLKNLDDLNRRIERNILKKLGQKPEEYEGEATGIVELDTSEDEYTKSRKTEVLNTTDKIWLQTGEEPKPSLWWQVQNFGVKTGLSALHWVDTLYPGNITDRFLAAISKEIHDKKAKGEEIDVKAIMQAPLNVGKYKSYYTTDALQDIGANTWLTQPFPERQRQWEESLRSFEEYLQVFVNGEMSMSMIPHNAQIAPDYEEIRKDMSKKYAFTYNLEENMDQWDLGIAKRAYEEDKNRFTALAWKRSAGQDLTSQELSEYKYLKAFFQPLKEDPGFTESMIQYVGSNPAALLGFAIQMFDDPLMYSTFGMGKLAVKIGGLFLDDLLRAGVRASTKAVLQDTMKMGGDAKQLKAILGIEGELTEESITKAIHGIDDETVQQLMKIQEIKDAAKSRMEVIKNDPKSKSFSTSAQQEGADFFAMTEKEVKDMFKNDPEFAKEITDLAKKSLGTIDNFELQNSIKYIPGAEDVQFPNKAYTVDEALEVINNVTKGHPEADLISARISDRLHGMVADKVDSVLKGEINTRFLTEALETPETFLAKRGIHWDLPFTKREGLLLSFEGLRNLPLAGDLWGAIGSVTNKFSNSRFGKSLKTWILPERTASREFYQEMKDIYLTQTSKAKQKATQQLAYFFKEYKLPSRYSIEQLQFEANLEFNILFDDMVEYLNKGENLNPRFLKEWEQFVEGNLEGIRILNEEKKALQPVVDKLNAEMRLIEKKLDEYAGYRKIPRDEAGREMFLTREELYETTQYFRKYREFESTIKEQLANNEIAPEEYEELINMVKEVQDFQKEIGIQRTLLDETLEKIAHLDTLKQKREALQAALRSELLTRTHKIPLTDKYGNVIKDAQGNVLYRQWEEKTVKTEARKYAETNLADKVEAYKWTYENLDKVKANGELVTEATDNIPFRRDLEACFDSEGNPVGKKLEELAAKNLENEYIWDAKKIKESFVDDRVNKQTAEFIHRQERAITGREEKYAKNEAFKDHNWESAQNFYINDAERELVIREQVKEIDAMPKEVQAQKLTDFVKEVKAWERTKKPNRDLISGKFIPNEPIDLLQQGIPVMDKSGKVIKYERLPRYWITLITNKLNFSGILNVNTKLNKRARMEVNEMILAWVDKGYFKQLIQSPGYNVFDSSLRSVRIVNMPYFDSNPAKQADNKKMILEAIDEFFGTYKIGEHTQLSLMPTIKPRMPVGEKVARVAGRKTAWMPEDLLRIMLKYKQILEPLTYTTSPIYEIISVFKDLKEIADTIKPRMHQVQLFQGKPLTEQEFGEVFLESHLTAEMIDTEGLPLLYDYFTSNPNLESKAGLSIRDMLRKKFKGGYQTKIKLGTQDFTVEQLADLRKTMYDYWTEAGFRQGERIKVGEEFIKGKEAKVMQLHVDPAKEITILYPIVNERVPVVPLKPGQKANEFFTRVGVEKMKGGKKVVVQAFELIDTSAGKKVRYIYDTMEEAMAAHPTVMRQRYAAIDKVRKDKIRIKNGKKTKVVGQGYRLRHTGEIFDTEEDALVAMGAKYRVNKTKQVFDVREDALEALANVDVMDRLRGGRTLKRDIAGVKIKLGGKEWTYDQIRKIINKYKLDATYYLNVNGRYIPEDDLVDFFEQAARENSYYYSLTSGQIEAADKLDLNQFKFLYGAGEVLQRVNDMTNRSIYDEAVSMWRKHQGIVDKDWGSEAFWRKLDAEKLTNEQTYDYKSIDEMYEEIDEALDLGQANVLKPKEIKNNVLHYEPGKPYYAIEPADPKVKAPHYGIGEKNPYSSGMVENIDLLKYGENAKRDEIFFELSQLEKQIDELTDMKGKINLYESNIKFYGRKIDELKAKINKNKAALMEMDINFEFGLRRAWKAEWDKPTVRTIINDLLKIQELVTEYKRLSKVYNRTLKQLTEIKNKIVTNDYVVGAKFYKEYIKNWSPKKLDAYDRTLLQEWAYAEEHYKAQKLLTKEQKRNQYYKLDNLSQRSARMSVRSRYMTEVKEGKKINYIDWLKREYPHVYDDVIQQKIMQRNETYEGMTAEARHISALIDASNNPDKFGGTRFFWDVNDVEAFIKQHPTGSKLDPNIQKIIAKSAENPKKWKAFIDTIKNYRNAFKAEAALMGVHRPSFKTNVYGEEVPLFFKGEYPKDLRKYVIDRAVYKKYSANKMDALDFSRVTGGNPPLQESTKPEHIAQLEKMLKADELGKAIDLIMYQNDIRLAGGEIVQKEIHNGIEALQATKWLDHARSYGITDAEMSKINKWVDEMVNGESFGRWTKEGWAKLSEARKKNIVYADFIGVNGFDPREFKYRVTDANNNDLAKLKDVWFAEGEAEFLNQSVRFFDDKTLNNAMRAWNFVARKILKLNKYWKPLATILIPRFFIRNFQTNLFLMYQNGFGEFANPKYWNDGWDLLTGQGYNKVVKYKGQEYTLRQLSENIADSDLLLTGFTGQTVPVGSLDEIFGVEKETQSALPFLKAMFQDTTNSTLLNTPKTKLRKYVGDWIPLTYGGRWQQMGYKLNGVAEDLPRVVNYLYELDRTGNHRWAVEQTRYMLHDYTDISSLDEIIKVIFPFWMWDRKNIPLQIKMLLERPRTFGLILKIQRMFRHITELPSDYDKLQRDWVTKSLGFPLPIYNEETETTGYALLGSTGNIPIESTELEPFVLAPQYPISSLLKDYSEWVSGITPAIKPILETYSILAGSEGTNVFTGQQIVGLNTYAPGLIDQTLGRMPKEMRKLIGVQVVEDEETGLPRTKIRSGMQYLLSHLPFVSAYAKVIPSRYEIQSEPQRIATNLMQVMGGTIIKQWDRESLEKSFYIEEADKLRQVKKTLEEDWDPYIDEIFNLARQASKNYHESKNPKTIEKYRILSKLLKDIASGKLPNPELAYLFYTEFRPIIDAKYKTNKATGVSHYKSFTFNYTLYGFSREYMEELLSNTGSW